MTYRKTGSRFSYKFENKVNSNANIPKKYINTELVNILRMN